MKGGSVGCLEKDRQRESIKDLIVPQRGVGVEEVLCFKYCGTVHFCLWGSRSVEAVGGKQGENVI